MKVGKSTLIKSLVKRFTRQTISDTNGPITVVSGKKRRLTFFECPNDMSSMVDCAKVADLVLLMVDASFGFEMVGFILLSLAFLVLPSFILGNFRVPEHVPVSRIPENHGCSDALGRL